MTASDGKCDKLDDKATRLLMACYAVMALTSAAEARFVHAAGALAMTVAVKVCSIKVSEIAHALMAIILAFEGRYIGTVGFALTLVGAEPLANALLAMHYGLVGLDAEDEPMLGRLASGLAAVNYAVV